MPEKYETWTSDGRRLTGTLDDFSRIRDALLHAASDMAQTIASCDMLEHEREDSHRARALETALVVCYCRAFTESTLKRLSSRSFAPKKGTEHRKIHDVLWRLRQKVYAHTDSGGGRSIENLAVEIDGEIAHVTHVERWHPLDRRLLPAIRRLCEEQGTRLRLEAVRLDGAIRREAGSS
jgi:hypothetical protein